MIKSYADFISTQQAKLRGAGLVSEEDNWMAMGEYRRKRSEGLSSGMSDDEAHEAAVKHIQHFYPDKAEKMKPDMEKENQRLKDVFKQRLSRLPKGTGSDRGPFTKAALAAGPASISQGQSDK